MLAAFGAWNLTASLAAAEVFEVSLPAEFSGIMEVQGKGESRPMSMPIYISKNRTRVDMVSPTMPDMAGSGLQRGARSPMEDLFPMVTIFLPDQGKQIIMLPAKKVAAQEDIQPAALKTLKEGQHTRVKVDSSNYEGEATVDGHP